MVYNHLNNKGEAVNKAQKQVVDDFYENYVYDGYTNRLKVNEFVNTLLAVDPTPDPPKYKIIKNNDDVVDEDLTQEQATIFLHTLMKSYVRDSHDLEYYNKGDSLTIFKDGENIYYNLEQE